MPDAYYSFICVTDTCNRMPLYSSKFFILWSVENHIPHSGLPVKTNHLSNQAHQSPTVGEEWDIMDLSNERQQKLGQAIPARPHRAGAEGQWPLKPWPRAKHRPGCPNQGSRP